MGEAATTLEIQMFSFVLRFEWNEEKRLQGTRPRTLDVFRTVPSPDVTA
jgi:hypothetical protein